MKSRVIPIALCASLALCAAPAPAVSLWELAMTDRPGTAREALAIADAEMVHYEQLRARGFLPSGIERATLEHLAQGYAQALSASPRNAAALVALARLEDRLGRYGRVHFERSRAYAEHALSVSPVGPGATDALFTLALAHTRLERFEEARDAYLRELDFTLEDPERAVVYGNLGDTYVSLGDLPRAIDAYRAAISAQPSAMGWLGLAVTLDRDGRDDYAPAADQAVIAAVHAHSARRASRGLPPLPDDGRSLSQEIANPNVFFVPGYDRHYYDAIADEAIARAMAPTDDAVAEVRRAAVTAWEFYLQLAPLTERWRPRAERHLRDLRALSAPRPNARRGPVEVE